MEKDWLDFKSLHSNIAGAREAFEKACETLFREHYKNENVQQVEIKQGDGGIDIFIGDYGVSPITVIQCKFFLNELKTSQHSQINKSFEKALKSSDYKTKEWILAIPRTLVTDEHKWWGKWKQKKEKQFSLDENFIQLKNGNELIDLMKKHNVYNSIFKITDSLLIEDTNDKITQLFNNKLVATKKSVQINNSIKIKDILFNNYREELEDFYLEREDDNFFYSNLKIDNVWIYGISGVGKTTLINRNITKNKKEYTFCDLSSINVTSIDDILIDIKCTLIEKHQVSEKKSNNQIKALNSVLLEITKNRIDHIIVIDEIKIPNSIFPEFMETILQLTNFFNNSEKNGNIKFVISAINKPTTPLKKNIKLTEYFNFITLEIWEDDDIKKLLELLLSYLDIKINEKQFDLIVSSSNGLPRLLKKILKKIVLSFELKDWTIERAIKEAEREYY